MSSTTGTDVIVRHGLARIGLLLCIGLAAGCAESTNGTTSSDTATPHTTDANLIVEVHDNDFVPDATEVDVGETVAWDFSTARRAHNVVFDSGPESEILDEGSWTTAFDEPGTYQYECTLHAGMTGRVTVVDS